MTNNFSILTVSRMPSFPNVMVLDSTAIILYGLIVHGVHAHSRDIFLFLGKGLARESFSRLEK